MFNKSLKIVKNSKIKSQGEIEKIVKRLRGQNSKIVTCNGSFDMFHYDHLTFLEGAKKAGDILILLLNSDASVKSYKGPGKPINNQKVRARMLAALECVDYVVVFDEDKPLSLLEKIKPHKHVKGGSFIPERIKEEKELLDKWNGEFKNFELEEGYSTTNIIDKISETGK